jgi:hypothetical protein
VIFEQTLDDWYTDETLWPQKRSLKLFREWCDVRLRPIVPTTRSRSIADPTEKKRAGSRRVFI